MSSVHLPDHYATQNFGSLLGRLLPVGSVLLLAGDLGSGKTTFVQGIAAGLGVTDPVVSPTFTLINEYPEGRIPLYHLDLYRLSPAETADLYLENYWLGLEFPLGIVAIEWAERLPYLPDNYLQLNFTYLEDSSRQVEIIAIGSTPGLKIDRFPQTAKNQTCQ
jgi:tRNA threonylcarbamoyladenosine biosynthesis protein TsaE